MAGTLGGEQQMLAIARAATSPRLLLLDEPSMGSPLSCGADLRNRRHQPAGHDHPARGAERSHGAGRRPLRLRAETAPSRNPAPPASWREPGRPQHLGNRRAASPPRSCGLEETAQQPAQGRFGGDRVTPRAGGLRGPRHTPRRGGLEGISVTPRATEVWRGSRPLQPAKGDDMRTDHVRGPHHRRGSRRRVTAGDRHVTFGQPLRLQRAPLFDMVPARIVFNAGGARGVDLRDFQGSSSRRTHPRHRHGVPGREMCSGGAGPGGRPCALKSRSRTSARRRSLADRDVRARVTNQRQLGSEKLRA